MEGLQVSWPPYFNPELFRNNPEKIEIFLLFCFMGFICTKIGFHKCKDGGYLIGSMFNRVWPQNNIIPFLKGDADMIGLVCNTLRKLLCMSDEGYETFLMDLEDYKSKLEEEEWIQASV